MAPSNSKLIAELMNNNTTIDADAIPNGSGVSIGTIVPFAGTSAPTGFLICDGSEISVTTYADLYTAIGTTWGTLTDGAGGAGSTHFRIPDLQNDFIRGKSGTRAVGASESESTRLRNVVMVGQGTGSYNIPSDAIGRQILFNVSGARWTNNPNQEHPQTFGNHPITHNEGLGSETWTWKYETEAYGAGNEIRPRNKTALYCIKF